jgi:hypothetical protein
MGDWSYTLDENTDDSLAHAHCMLHTQSYKDTHLGCVMLIAFPLQHWLDERASLLRHTYIAYLDTLNFSLTLLVGC